MWKKIVRVVCGWLGHSDWKFIEFVYSDKKIRGWFVIVGEKQRCSGCGTERIKKT